MGSFNPYKGKGTGSKTRNRKRILPSNRENSTSLGKMLHQGTRHEVVTVEEFTPFVTSRTIALKKSGTFKNRGISTGNERFSAMAFEHNAEQQGFRPPVGAVFPKGFRNGNLYLLQLFLGKENQLWSKGLLWHNLGRNDMRSYLRRAG